MGPDLGGELLGRPLVPLLEDMLARAKLDVLFEAQQIGHREPSGATAGTLLYTAGSLGLPDASLAPHLAELAGLVTDAGTVVIPPEYRTTVETTWTDAWCAAAVTRRPHLFPTDRARVLASSLLAQQEASGGWGLRADRQGRPHPFFCLPAALALHRLARLDVVPAKAVADATAGLVSYLQGQAKPRSSLTTRIIAFGLLTLFVPRDTVAGELEQLHDDLWHDAELDFEPDPIGRDDQPLWYTTVDRPLMYLYTRRLWPVVDPVNVILADEVVQSFDAGVGGWKNHAEDADLCTWRTAQAILAVHRLGRDLDSGGLDTGTWKARASDLLRSSRRQEYDVGISFSGAQRDLAERMRTTLRDAGLTVFYDRDYAHETLGADLNTYLHEVYFNQCRFAVTIISEEFVLSPWSGTLEWKAILARLAERSDFLLPYMVEAVDVPGLDSALGYVSAKDYTPEDFARIVIRKVLARRD